MTVVESIVAIDGQSRYPGYKRAYFEQARKRGKFMPKGPRIESDNDDLGKDSSKSSGSKEPKASKKKSEAQIKKEEQTRRLEELRKEQRESQESTRNSQERARKAQEAVEQLRGAGQLKDFPIDREAADAAVEASKKAQAGVGEPDIVLETSVGNSPVGIYKKGDGYVLTGLTERNFQSKILKDLFTEAGIEGKVFPKDFDDWTIGKRREFVAEYFSVRPANYKELQDILPGGAPDPIDLLDPAVVAGGVLSRYVTEMKRESGKPFERQRYESFQKIDEAITEAVLSGSVTITAAEEADLAGVRQLLEERIRVLSYQESAQRKEVNFDEQFGQDYKDTRDAIRNNDSATLRALMENTRDVADLILNWQTTAPLAPPAGIGRAFNAEDEDTWPPIDRAMMRRVVEVTRALGQAAGLPNGKDRILTILSGPGPHPPTDVALLNRFISRDRNEQILQKVDSFFDNIFTNMDKDAKKSIAGDIEENAATARASIVSGLIQFDQRMGMLFRVVERNPFVGVRGALREWRGLFLINGVEKSVEYYKLTQPPENWRDTPAKIYELINVLEPTGLTPQDLSQVIQGAYSMLSQIELDTDFGRGMHFEMKEALEAFKTRQSIAITAHIESQDPTALQRIYKDINGDLESTFTSMIARFRRDGKGRRWYDAHDKEINLFDPAKKLYSERLREDRIRMNMVEEMTKYSIDTFFNAATVDRIKRAVGYDNLPPARQATWQADLEQTRQWLRERLHWRAAHGATTPIDPENFHHKRPATVADWATEPDLRHGITKAVVQDWYDRNTLHGAYGVVDEEGFNQIAGHDYTNPATGVTTFIPGELAAIFKKPGETDQDVGNRLRKMFEEGITWQQVRRAEMRQRIRNELATMGLKYDRNVKFGEKGHPGNLKAMDADSLDNLLESGYIASLDINAYDLTWLFEWSTYNMIHIYGHDVHEIYDPTTKAREHRDEYKAVVQNRSSDLYFASIVDHNWEYLHPDFEDRGRGRPEDVNDTFRREFIGRHKWLFGHVSMAARFIPSFLNDHDEDLIRARTQQLVDANDFHNEQYEESFEDFLRGVAIRELFVEGAISFGDKNFSEVAAQRGALNKFNPIDNAADRALVVKWLLAGAFQSYLANPEGETFKKLTTKEEGFMSTRDPRLFPWMEVGLKAHWEVVHNLNHEFFNQPNVTNQQMENFIESLVSDGYVEKEQGEKFKNRNLGFAPGILGTAFFRGIRAWYEEEERENQVKRRGWILRLLVLFFWTIPVQGLIAGSKGVGEEFKKIQK